MKNRNGKSLFAIVLILIGVLLVLQNFNIPFVKNLSIGYFISIFWPLFILVPGLKMLKQGVNFGGIILTIFGALFLLDNVLGVFNINFNVGFVFQFIWPALLILIGYRMLKPNAIKNDDEKEFVKDYSKGEMKTNISHNINFSSKAFKYTKENTPVGISKLELNIFFGGAEISIEKGIQVILIGQYLFGGHEFFGLDSGGIHSDIKESRYDESDGQTFDQTLIIKANITFGGLEIIERWRK